ncbi:MAG: hypothetical protein V3S44_03875, partial [Alphaproteobacteria bacterium]
MAKPWLRAHTIRDGCFRAGGCGGLPRSLPCPVPSRSEGGVIGVVLPVEIAEFGDFSGELQL